MASNPFENIGFDDLISYQVKNLMEKFRHNELIKDYWPLAINIGLSGKFVPMLKEN